MNNERIEADFEALFSEDYDGKLSKTFTSVSIYITILVSDDYEEGRYVEIRLPL